MAELRTRKPTGRVQYPLVLVEGEDKSGKSFTLAQFAASPRVGQVFYLDLGDGTLDEYARLGNYELLVHDGTFTSIIEQIEAACAVPSDPERPNVVGVDGGTYLWSLLKSWTDRRARNSHKVQQLLREDPDAEVDPAMNLWNDAKDRWARVMQALKLFPGIGIVTAVGREVSKVEKGVPVAGQTEWSIDAEKTTTSWVSAWVRLRRDPRDARLVGVRSLDIQLPRGGLVLPDQNMLDHLVFNVLGAGTGKDGGSFGDATAVQMKVGVAVNEAKAKVLTAVVRAYEGLTGDEAKDEAKRLWEAYELGGGPEVHPDTLMQLLVEIADGTAKEKHPPAPKVEPDPEADPEPPNTDETMDPALVDAIVAEVEAMEPTQVKGMLHTRGLSRTGSHDDLRRRLARALYEERKPSGHEEAAQEAAGALPGAATGEHPTPADAEAPGDAQPAQVAAE